MTKLTKAPQPAHRVIPSQFPPIPIFDTVATGADLLKAMDVEGWTNDRMVKARVNRLDQSDWVYGFPNCSIVMAAFLHVGPYGMRFNGPELGAWYAAGSLQTSIFEVAHHLRRECVSIGKSRMMRTYRAYSCTIDGNHLDIRGQQTSEPGLYHDENYAASQAFGEHTRYLKHDGILYDSLRHEAGENVVVYRPKLISDILQADHFDVHVEAGSNRIGVSRKTL